MTTRARPLAPDVAAAGTTVRRSHRVLAGVVVALAALGSLLVFFRETVWSGGRLVTGNIGDPRLYIVTLEHWLAAMRGDVSFRSPIFFWPQRGVLGYTDCVALFVPPYAVARALGVDPYLALQATLMTVKAVGFVAMYHLLCRFMRVGRGVAILGAALFTISNASYLAAGHCQLMAVALVPLVWGLVWGWVEAPGSTGRLVAAAVLSALLCFTSFYIGWFMLLVSAIAVVASIAVGAAADGAGARWRRIRSASATGRRAVTFAAVAFATALVPFAFVYGPVLRGLGGRSFDEVVVYTPEPWQFGDVGPDNWLWGWLMRVDGPPAAAFFAGELRRGWPPLLLAVFATTVAVAIWRRWRVGRERPSPCDVDDIAVVLGLTVVGAWLLVAQYGGVTPWWAVWALVPGGTAIRVPVRITHVLNVLVIAVAMAGVQRLFGRGSGGSAARRAAWSVATVALAAVLLAEHLNRVPIAQIDADAERAKFARIERPPPDCRAFYVTRPPTADLFPVVEAQIDGMLVAYEYLLPTLNGHSGKLAPGWNLAFDERLVANARAWAVARGVTDGLCVLDLVTGTWKHDSASSE